MDIIETDNYQIWFYRLTFKEQAQVKKRLNRIKESGYLGDIDNLGDKLYELRWKNGWRVYWVRKKNKMYLLVGGHKNEQEKNIKTARLNLGRY